MCDYASSLTEGAISISIGTTSIRESASYVIYSPSIWGMVEVVVDKI